MSCAPSNAPHGAIQSFQHTFITTGHAGSSVAAASCPRVRHLLSGTFNSNSLHLLSFDTLTHTLSLLNTIPAFGPHSFLTPGRSNGAAGRLVDVVYATTWADKKEICAWKVNWHGKNEAVEGLTWLGNSQITATSSYVHASPPPYAGLTAPSYNNAFVGPSRFLYSAGGPTGEVHSINPQTGALTQKVQEIVFLQKGQEALAKADKTRKALRYGAHNVDIGQDGLTFIADVGRNAILTYKQDPESGALLFLSETPLPAHGDGPRHVVPSPCGRFVYCVTEHTSYIDIYSVKQDGRRLEHVERASILPSHEPEKSSEQEYRHTYRGDTVRLSPDGKHVFATTRGMHTGTRGFVKVWRIDEQALEEAYTGKGRSARIDERRQVLQEKVLYETRNSGGKANAIEFAPRYPTKNADDDSTGVAGTDNIVAAYDASEITPDYAVLTDDEQGYVTVLVWDGKDLRDADSIQLPALDDDVPQGASQAIWLS